MFNNPKWYQFKKIKLEDGIVFGFKWFYVENYDVFWSVKSYLGSITKIYGKKVFYEFGCKYINFGRNKFGYKWFEIFIGRKGRFFNLLINNSPTFWIYLYWDFYNRYGKHII